MHDTNNDAPIYRDLDGEGDEFRRALKHACAGLRPADRLLFDPTEGDWDSFYSGIFSEFIAAHFATVYSAAVAGEIERVAELDERFVKDLDGAARARLSASANTVFEARAGAAGMRLLDRLRERRPDCAFTTAFAAHAASFNVPLLHALMAYLAVEWRAGEESVGLELENSREWEKMFTGQLLSSPEPIRQILSRSLRGWAEVA